MSESADGSAAYRALLERLTQWFDQGRREHPGVIPCREGCSACCHGPFDISVADVELLEAGVRALPEGEWLEVRRRAEALAKRMEALSPGWSAPHAIADLGEEGFDRLSEALAAEPCPLLDPDGRCRIYADRPLVCRLIGLGMHTREGGVIENACPIQDRFPGYAELPPVGFDLESFEEVERACLVQAAGRRIGRRGGWEFETTIAAAIADLPATRSPWPT
ncbi:MAG: YkgJ family cysteine cluster protein [Gemmatimonadales bacterium]